MSGDPDLFGVLNMGVYKSFGEFAADMKDSWYTLRQVFCGVAHLPQTDEWGNKEWWRNDHLHRLDGPAVEHANGDKEWWRFGKLCHPDGRIWGDELSRKHTHGARRKPAAP